MRKRPFRGFCLNGCGTPVFSRERNAKYCSLTCSNARYKKDGRFRPCARCGKTVATKRQNYCSQDCYRTEQFEHYVKSLLDGTYRAANCNKLIRRYLVSRFGERCSRCGWDVRHKRTGRVPVEVEHIDGNWRNNAIENLTLLCPNCHSLTDTFRGLNRGRGRAHRLGGRGNPLGGRSGASESAE